MRLGVLKNILDIAINEDYELYFDVYNLYEGKKYLIHDYNILINALENLCKMSWVHDEGDIVNELIYEYGKNNESVEISPEQHATLEALDVATLFRTENV